MTPSSTAKGGGAGKKVSTNTTTKTTGEQQRKRNQNVSDAMNSAAPPTLAQLLTAAGVPVNPLDGSTTQQQLLQFQQQQNAAANFATAAALTFTTQLKSFGNNMSGLVGGPANSGGQPASPSFWNQFYAQQALVGSIYGQQQQLQAAQQALSNGANLNNERLSFLSNFSTGMGGGAQPMMSNRIFDNEDLKELLKMDTAARTQQLQQQLFGAAAGFGEINSNDAAKKRKLSNVNTKKKAGQNTNNNKNNNKRKQPDSAQYQQPGSRGNSAFSPFANSAGDGNNIFTSSELRKVASLQHQKKKKRGADGKKNSKDNSKDNKKNSKDNKATRQEKKPPGRGKGKKQEETNQKTMQLADAAMSFGGEQISDIKNDRKILAEVMKLQEGYLKETPEEREKREKDDAAKKMKQLSTRGHTARATEKEELYKSIVDVDGNLLKPDVLERFEANTNKMTQLNKEHEEERKKAGLGGMKNDGTVTDLAQAAVQKITGASDDVMAKVRGILEEELSDAETDIAEGDETGELDSQAAKVKNDDAGTEEKKSGVSPDKVPGKDIKVRSRSWSQEEDDLVQVLVSHVGPKKWALIAGQLSGKTQKQAYARWRDYLQPGLTSRPWTRWEETHLLDCQAHIGNQWAILARFMPGRSPNAIKNKFHATKRKMERNVGAFTNEKSDFSKLTPALTSDEESIKKVVEETKAASKKASQTRS